MSSPITYPIVVDDKDLDDAALWAMIDSASASHSSSKSKPLAIKYHNRQSPSPISKPLPPPPPSKFSRTSRDTSDGGEVVQDPWPYRPPRKVARISGSDSCETSPLALVRTAQRSPSANVYSSPEIGMLNPAQEISSYTEVSPRCFGIKDEDKDNGMRHSLSGMFPTVSLFKEYQNAAMAVIYSFAFCFFIDWNWNIITKWNLISFTIYFPSQNYRL